MAARLVGPSSIAFLQTTIERRTTSGTTFRLKPPDYRSGRGNCLSIPVSMHRGTAVPLLNTDVVPFFEEHSVPIKIMLSDNSREFCGRLPPLRAVPLARRRALLDKGVDRFNAMLLDEHYRNEAAGPGLNNRRAMQEALIAYSLPITPHDSTKVAT